MNTNSSPPPMIKNPPSGFFQSLQYLGPGLILSAAIVGSGELIATTSLGADAGFTLLWVILLGCLVKVVVQLEFGKHCITHGMTTFQSWNLLGKTKCCGLHWTVYAGLLYMFATFAGQAGVLGGAAQVGTYIVPGTQVGMWVLLLVVILGLLVFHGKYGFIEITALILNAIFVCLILVCAYLVQQTDYAFSAVDISSGFSFQLPAESLALAAGAFGITGVAAGEIAMYPYWCLEKGYARWTGPKEDSEAWLRRAKGWMRVMTLDAVLSMIVYTISTIAFYILGATILNAFKDQIADDNEFIYNLSVIFTEVLGDQSRWIFMICAFTVLFSTIFANNAGFGRMWTDFFGLCGKINWQDKQQKDFSISIMAFLFPFVCGLIYMSVQKPLLLVIFMGISNALFLLVVAFQAVVYRYQHTEPRLKPSVFYDIAFWISLLSIGFMAGRSMYSLIS